MDKFVKINFLEMSCGNEGHDGSKLVAFCVDKSCTFPNKFVCLDCIFQFHEQHKMIKLKLIQDKLNANLESELLVNDEDAITSKLRDSEEKIKMEVEKIKTNILEIFNNKVNNFIVEVNERILEHHKVVKSETFDPQILTKKEVKHLNKDEMDLLTNFLNSNYAVQVDSLNMSQVDSLANNNKHKNPVSELDKFDENFKKYIQEVSKSVTEYLNTKFLVAPCNLLFSDNLYFEWTEKTYGNYGFLYQLTNGKLTATKVQNDGTITILRAKDKLNFNENYYIEFVIDCKKGGDVEVGFGKDSIGPSCWLRSVGAYGFTNQGVYENGKVSKKDIKVEDGDIVGMEIYLKSNQKYCKVLKNMKSVSEFKIDIEEVYPMCAIRKIGNSITVRDFKTLN